MLYIENKSNDGFSKRFYGFPSSAILLDRMNLSARNGWLDEEGRVYIIFTIEEIKGALGCAEKKAVKLLDELEKKCGLIERSKKKSSAEGRERATVHSVLECETVATFLHFTSI